MRREKVEPEKERIKYLKFSVAAKQNTLKDHEIELT